MRWLSVFFFNGKQGTVIIYKSIFRALTSVVLKSHIGIFRVRLDTTYFAKNWKHCSKIIFKYVNSVMRPVNSAWTVNEQCINSAFCLLHNESMCMNSTGYCSYTLKKKKTQTLNLKHGSKRTLSSLNTQKACSRSGAKLFFFF